MHRDGSDRPLAVTWMLETSDRRETVTGWLITQRPWFDAPALLRRV